jgi:uncharacterized membrane protein YhaH (DUF805 family)
MNWINLYLGVLKNYATFQGRAQRKDYWVFTLISTIVSIALIVIGALSGVKDLLSNIYGLAVLIPSIAAGVRRLHDTNRSGWWLLVPIVNLVFLVQDSQPGENRFGQNPKGNLSVQPPSKMEKYLLPVGRSGWAIAAGYFALFSVLIIPAPAALFCGVMALNDISKNPDKIGKPRAFFGIVMGSIGIILLFIFLAKRYAHS